MTSKQKLGATAAVALLVAGVVFAQVQHSAKSGGMQHHFQFIATYLGLTDAQKETFQAVLQDAKTQAEPIVTQLKTGHENMAAAIKAGKPESELTQIATAQGALMGQMAAIHAKAFAKIYAQLTPEQKAKADQLHEHMQGAMQSHFGGMHHPNAPF